jgi:hypothetical protein
MTEPLKLVAFLERLAARPIPQVSMGDKDRLHEAAVALRAEHERRQNRERGRVVTAQRRALRKTDRADQPIEALGSE